MPAAVPLRTLISASAASSRSVRFPIRVIAGVVLLMHELVRNDLADLRTVLGAVRALAGVRIRGLRAVLAERALMVLAVRVQTREHHRHVVGRSTIRAGWERHDALSSKR